MTIYRNDYRSFAGSSCGFSFHSSKREAKAEAVRMRKKTKENDADNKVDEVETSKISFEPLTKSTVIALLNRYASHNDNG